MSALFVDVLSQSLFAVCADCGLELSDTQQAQLVGYLAVLEQWNAKINLIADREPTTLWARHIADCLMLGCIETFWQPSHWLDVGSGAGLPGLIMAIMNPHCRVLSVERTGKKVAFQQEGARLLELNNHRVWQGDIRELPSNSWQLAYKAENLSPCSKNNLQAAIARAFAPLPQLLSMAREFLPLHAQLWAMLGKSGAAMWSELTPQQKQGFQHVGVQAYPQIGYDMKQKTFMQKNLSEVWVFSRV